MTRILVATTSRTHYPDIDSENAGILSAFERMGVVAETADWHDPAIDWAAADAVLIRTTWDYPDYFEQFMSWLDRLETDGAIVINPVAVARWNLDKSYLFGLASAGAPIVEARPTTIEETILASDGPLVVKPLRGVGSTGAVLLQVGEQTTVTVPSLVSPFQSRIAEGELSVFVVEGTAKFCVRKTPSADDWRVQPQWGGRYEVEPSIPAGAALAAERTFSTIVETVRDASELCYLRIDLVADESDRWNVMEVEAVEPSFYCSITDDIADSVCSAIVLQLDRRVPAN